MEEWCSTSDLFSMKQYAIYFINGHMSAPTALALTGSMKEGRMVFLFHATGSMACLNAILFSVHSCTMQSDARQNV
jgi:hypothetical protein